LRPTDVIGFPEKEAREVKEVQVTQTKTAVRSKHEPSPTIISGKEQAAIDLPRRVTAKFRERQREIIKSVRRLLIEDGYAALSMRRVAERCNMQLGNLQHYFKTRDDLVVAFVISWVRYEKLERRTLESDGGDPFNTAMRWADDVFMHLADRDNGIANVQLWALACHDDVAHRQIDAWYTEQRTYYGKLLQRARPDIDEQQAEDMAMALLALCEGMALQVSTRSPRKAELDRLRRCVAQSARAIVMA
jgi:AcrR family transcriptional regulator